MFHNWLNKILTHKVSPPEGVWVKITNELDKENESAGTNIKAKIFAHEVVPPAKVLGNIFTELDKDDGQILPAYISKVYNHKAEAPENTWENIVKELDKNDTKIILLNNNKTSNAFYFRLVAASVIVIIAISIIWQNNKKTDNKANKIASSSQSRQNISSTKKEKINLPAADTKKNNSEKLIAQNTATKKTEQQAPNTYIPGYVKGNEIIDLAQAPNTVNNEKLQTASGQTPMDISLINTPNTYISITGADGQTVKVSSKFSNLIGYLTEKNSGAHENLDIIIQESAKWRTVIAGWRAKMSNNSVAPSLVNFMDIIELGEVLEDQK
jgi:cytoskeletal protein RodZ